MRMWVGAALAGAMMVATPANAAVVINLTEVGGDILGTTFGTLDLTGLTTAFQSSGGPIIAPSAGLAAISGSGMFQGYSGFSPASAIGAGTRSIFGTFDGASATGGFVLTGNNGGTVVAFVPVGYVSGSPISAAARFANQSFGTAGLTPGSYLFSSAADSVRINVGSAASAAPEPGTWAMMIFGFGAVGGVLRRKQRQRLNATSTKVAFA